MCFYYYYAYDNNLSHRRKYENIRAMNHIKEKLFSSMDIDQEYLNLIIVHK